MGWWNQVPGVWVKPGLVLLLYSGSGSSSSFSVSSVTGAYSRTPGNMAA